MFGMWQHVARRGYAVAVDSSRVERDAEGAGFVKAWTQL